MSRPGDVDGLARSLERIASNDELRARMAAAARARGALLPTWEDTAARFFSVIRTVVGREGMK